MLELAPQSSPSRALAAATTAGECDCFSAQDSRCLAALAHTRLALVSAPAVA